MTNTYKPGPGKLLLGTVPLAVQAQLTSVTVGVKENVKSDDPVPTLDGGEVTGDDDVTFDFTLSGNLFQDLAVGAVVDWSWDNMGTEQPFVYVPNNELNRAVNGVVHVVPIEIGGEVKTKARSDFEYRIKGKPVFGAYDPVDDEVTEDV